MGSRVIRGHLVVVPIENFILYVQLRLAAPLFAHRVDQYGRQTLRNPIQYRRFRSALRHS